MISISNLSIQFGGAYLFEDVSFLINQKDHIGLVGKNGAGKSTLLKILADEYSIQAGSIAKPNGITIGYLPQEMKHNSGNTVFKETELAYTELKQLEKKLEEYNKEITERTDYESESYHDLINKLTEATEKFNHLGGYSIAGNIERVLFGLGFERKDMDRLTDEFSGGWRMRIELAKLLLQMPDLLLLDEPTNHLDIESIQWLEDFLVNYQGAVVLVSHDKAFLDAITHRTIEISLGHIYDYKANYSKYVELRTQRREQQMSEQKNQQKYIDQTQQLIDKYRYKATKAAFAQSLIKKLDKIDIIEVDEEDNAALRFTFPPSSPCGKIILEVANLGKSYDTKEILRDISFITEKQERIAFVGKNGEGKSTLSKIIAGVEPHTGNLKTGHNVNIGYYAQNQAEELDPELTVFETIDNIAVGEIRKKVRNLLGSFLFSGDTVDKRVKVLSGGEKARLAMCKLMLHPYNVLVLDEPTNHLDMRSKDILKQALLKYDGTLIVVSHDRDFLMGLTTKVFEFKNKTIREYIGDLGEFLQQRKITSLTELETKPKNNSTETTEKVSETKLSYEQKKEQDRELKKIQNQVKKCESEIARLEAEIAKMDETLLDPAKYKDAMNDKNFFSVYDNLKKQLQLEMDNWEALLVQLG